MLDHVNDLNRIKPRFLGKVNAFRQALHQACNADLIDHLGQLSRTAFAQTLAGFRIDINDRLGARKSALVTAAHHTQLRILSPRLPARDWRVDKAHL